jgi:hypothetical protein
MERAILTRAGALALRGRPTARRFEINFSHRIAAAPFLSCPYEKDRQSEKNRGLGAGIENDGTSRIED